MIAVDANIVVRLLVNDDKQQSQVAFVLVTSQPTSFTLAVLMETEWVLRSVYRFTRSEISTAIRGLLGLRHLTVDDPFGAQHVLAAYETGMGFADAVHLAQASRAEGFVTFDRDLVKAAQKLDCFVQASTLDAWLNDG